MEASDKTAANELRHRIMDGAISSGSMAQWDAALSQIVETSLMDSNPLKSITHHLVELSERFDLSMIPAPCALSFMLRIDAERQLSIQPNAWTRPNDDDHRFGDSTFEGSSDAWLAMEQRALQAIPKLRLGGR